jgi:ABC-type Zn2+ transport system substrate-binding protein/surface adhesin
MKTLILSLFAASALLVAPTAARAADDHPGANDKKDDKGKDKADHDKNDDKGKDPVDHDKNDDHGGLTVGHK